MIRIKLTNILGIILAEAQKRFLYIFWIKIDERKHGESISDFIAKYPNATIKSVLLIHP